MNLRIAVLSAPLLLVAALASPLALASGDESAPAKPNCPKGQVWDSKSKKCVLQTSRLVPDADRTDYAYRLAKDGRYEEALALLDTLKQPNTAKALNYRGYATRKLGRTDEGIGYYLQSVKLDPQYAQVREYLGEAYVIKGRLDLAQAQLQQIKSICGSTCEEYQDLAEAINGSSKT
ncbi:MULTISPECIES: tetratricopeptide repeat protein [unclassified Pseudomonas]|uniref:tetratricopeptide repeat protein n=1 Tax=unclassified Pseudomonas TaxID=196821 RepID=UPI002AC9B3A4|nr:MULTISPECIES: tetratricopeptide repeat protein [unclassified Pseudomonas]MEB0045261.1 tetratricopeptide repeat protein [Pseudomonas sp. Dout3]MEB0096383.1 tetratricopeptide repeat protein [Pseudomonas sp. DC1.2]WPX61340.1 tetratricopeptide repeat protein [Pseudomonas sp. DC1.2]